MLNHLIEDAREQGARQMFLEVRESNRAAMQMYLNHGFNEVGRRRNYYPTAEGREDALVYGLQLRFDQI
jgi:ribosomal-protein-alanine N-acetyltransferase